MKGAGNSVEAACATSIFLQHGTGTVLSLGAVQSQCIYFNMFLIDISCYNVLFIYFQETVNATGEAGCYSVIMML